MSSQQLQRPDFYEGQTLGAADLDQAVDYGRHQLSRHELGSHSWGIVAGLDLIEVDAVDGQSVSVYLEPGLAVDGFGRQIVVRSRTKVSTDLFTHFTTVGGGNTERRVRLWLKYVGSAQGGPRSGFETCSDVNGQSRVEDGWEIVVGERTHDEQHEDVVLDGLSVHAIEITASRAAGSRIWCDESLPYQTFPGGDDDPEWLVPIGIVRWDAANQRLISTHEATGKEDRRHYRINRRHAGAICEEILAPDGWVRIRERASTPSDESDLSGDCTGLALGNAALGYADSDLVYENETARVEDLLWVEGNLRATGDVKLFGSKLDLRNEDGYPNDVPLHVRRVEANPLVDPAGVNGRDLQLVIGAASDGFNRLIVGPLSAPDAEDVSELFSIKDDGKVGVRTGDPLVPLHVEGTDADDADLAAGGLVLIGSLGDLNVVADNDSIMARNDGVASPLKLQPFGGDLLVGTADDGRVGIGADPPETKLHVQSSRTAHVLVESADAAEDAGVRFRTPNREFFSGVPANETHWTLRDEIIGTSRLVVSDTGFLGVGTTAPEAMIHVETSGASHVLVESTSTVQDAGLVARTPNREYFSGVPASETFWTVRDEAGGAHRLSVTSTGRVGIGTTAPAAELHVNGDIRLDASETLFAPGCRQNAKLIYGRVTGTSSGSGWSAVKIGDIYTVSFSPPTFAGTPIVVVTSLDDSTGDNVATVMSITTGSFQVKLWDADTEDLTSGDFTFVAIGQR